MAFLDRIRSWWSKDALEREEQEELAGTSQADRDAAEEDFEGRKDDVAARSGLLELPAWPTTSATPSRRDPSLK